MFRFSKANVYNWIKKTAQNLKNDYYILELDELYWFVEKKSKSETRKNTYVMTMVSCEPRQIVGYGVARDKSPERIQAWLILRRAQKSTILTGIWDILTSFIQEITNEMCEIRGIPLRLKG